MNPDCDLQCFPLWLLRIHTFTHLNEAAVQKCAIGNLAFWFPFIKNETQPLWDSYWLQNHSPAKGYQMRDEYIEWTLVGKPETHSFFSNFIGKELKDAICTLGPPLTLQCMSFLLYWARPAAMRPPGQPVGRSLRTDAAGGPPQAGWSSSVQRLAVHKCEIGMLFDVILRIWYLYFACVCETLLVIYIYIYLVWRVIPTLTHLFVKSNRVGYYLRLHLLNSTVTQNISIGGPNNKRWGNNWANRVQICPRHHIVRFTKELFIVRFVKELYWSSTNSSSSIILFIVRFVRELYFNSTHTKNKNSKFPWYNS